MRKFIVLLISILLMLMPLTSCFSGSQGGGGGSQASKNESSEDADESELMPEIEPGTFKNLEEGLSALKDQGWKKSGDEYVYTTNEDGTKGEYRISAKGNKATLTVDFDYGADNNEMTDFYKDDAEAAMAVPAYWYSYVAAMLGISQGSADYTLSVAGKTVSTGTMTYDEAVDAANDYFD
ncbi:MAG: hypothetical protein IKE85_04000 [Mogibacterium sp.]|nr:hypothetical protein [Mogibacterium sp.]